MGLGILQIQQKCLNKCDYPQIQDIGSVFGVDMCMLSGEPVECSTIKSCNRPSKAWVKKA